VPPLPGEVWRHPTDLELYLGADMGGAVQGSRTAPAPRYIGEHGFVPDGGRGSVAVSASVTARPAAERVEVKPSGAASTQLAH
jgi:hypothetical protein